MTEEEFHKHWTAKHGPLASAWFQRNGLLGYTQCHTPTSTRNLAASVVEEYGYEMSPYDGHVEILLKNVEDLKKAVQDPEYPVKVAPDEAKFMNQVNSMVTVGWEEVYLRDGEIVGIYSEGKSRYT